MTNRRKRYSHEREHFPNIFLNDCLVDPNPNYPLAHAEHRQTYWLKWIILKLIEKSPGGKIYFGDLHQCLVTNSGYEDHIFRLAIGSLSTPNKFGCISVHYRNHSIESRQLSLTSRGSALVGETTAKEYWGVPFCFCFDYLQLIADDPWLKFPRNYADQIVPEKINLGYTLREASQYRTDSLKYLDKKTSAVLIFLRVLATSWKREYKRLGRLSDEQKAFVSPNFELISQNLLQSYEAILRHYKTDGVALYARLQEEWNNLLSTRELENFWEEIN
jgi:hypothetical protein